MKDIIELPILNNAPPTLDEQRLELRLRLQLNRRLLLYKFSDAQADNHFPRSTVMRFLTQQTTLHILKKLACTAIGIKTVKSVQYGFSLWQFVRNKLQQKK
jgi:hypothetical protein